MKINNSQELSNFVKEHRKLNGRSQTNVATGVGIYQPAISMFEKHSGHAQIDTLFRIAHELGLEFHLLPKESVSSLDEQWTEEW